MIFCAWQQIPFLFANSAIPWNHRALFDQMSVEYRGSLQNLSNYSQRGAKGTLRMQTHKKGGSTEHMNAVRTSLQIHTPARDQIHFLSSYTLFPLLPVTSSELRIISSNVSRRSRRWGCCWAPGRAWQRKTQHRQSNRAAPYRRHTDPWRSGGHWRYFYTGKYFPFLLDVQPEQEPRVCLSWTQEVRILMTVYDLFNYLKFVLLFGLLSTYFSKWSTLYCCLVCLFVC